MKQKIKFLILALSLVFLVSSVNLGKAATLTWHSSIKEGATFNWKVTEYSGEPVMMFGAFNNVTKGSKFTVNVTGSPPTVGDWSTLIFASSVSFADLEIDGVKTTSENMIYFLMSPVDIGNSSYGWESWVNVISVILWFANPSDFKTGNYTDGSKITYQLNNTGGSGNAQWALYYTLTYDTQTGLLQKYIFEGSNTSLSSKMAISIDSGGLLGDIPGFEILPVFASLIATIIIFHRKRKG